MNTPIRSWLAPLSIPIFALVLFSVASGYLNSLIPFAMGSVGIANSAAAFLTSAYYLGFLIAALGADRVITRLGHRSSFVGALLVLVTTTVLIFLSESLYIWLALRLVSGVACAIIFVVAESWLMIASEPKRQSLSLGAYMVTLYGGGSLGQMGLSWFDLNSNLPVWLIAGTFLIAILPLLRAPKFLKIEMQIDGEHVKHKTGCNRFALLSCFFSGVVLSAIYGLFPLEFGLLGHSTEEIGKIMALILIGGLLVQPVIGAISNYLSTKVLIMLFSSIGATSIVMLINTGVAANPALYVLLGMSAFSLYPLALNLACQGVPADRLVNVTQLILIGYSMGSIFGPLLIELVRSDKLDALTVTCCILTSTALISACSKLFTRKPALEIVNEQVSQPV